MDRTLRTQLVALLGEEAPTETGSPRLEPENAKLLGGLNESLISSQQELAAYHKKIVAASKASSRGEELRVVAMILKEVHSLMAELRVNLKEEFGKDSNIR